jgi:type VI secretion system secreted protein Hcp
MAADIFAKIANIKGESNDAKHKNEIDVLSWTWGVSQSGTMAHGSGGGEGKASFHDLTFTHRIDKATPLLLKACATGTHVPDATITVRKATQDKPEFLIVKLTDVVVTSVSMSVDRDDPTTVENVTLQFGKVDFEYKAQKQDGSLEPGLHFVYDIAANKVG